MPQIFKYVNLNDFPIHLPDGRGGQVLFRPGEATTRSWFGRFLLRGQLTKQVFGSPTNRVPKHVEEPAQVSSINIGNIQELAQALARVLATQKVEVRHTTVEHAVVGTQKVGDDFDTSGSAKKLADAMIAERVEKSGNFKELGSKSKGNKRADADQTVDLLSNLE
jgi:hypothetical protein